MFRTLINLIDINGLSLFDVSKVTSMYCMFAGSSGYPTNLSSLKALSKWDTSSVTDMRGVFYNFINLTSADDINFWNISKVTNSNTMFAIDDNGSSVLNPVHPTFKYLDESNVEHDVPGSWSSTGGFIKE